jgi:ABC-2 type transport system permease protein
MNAAVVGRMRAMGRAELTLLVRNKSAMFTALVIPVALTLAMKNTVDGMDLEGTGLSPGTVLMPGSLGFVLLFAVYANLVGTFVVRREDLVLKRLRTGEPRDNEILAGAALPSVTVALAQIVLLVAAGALLLGVGAPAAPHLLVAGVVLGMVLMVFGAAATAVFTRSSEGSQMTPVPLMMVSFVFSGVFVPLDILPDAAASVARYLPMTPVMDLIRGGWTGDLGALDTLRSLGVAVAWTALCLWVVRSRFRWEPRR